MTSAVIYIVAYLLLCRCQLLVSAEVFTYEVKDTAILPCTLPVYKVDAYWFYSGVNLDIYLTQNEQVYFNHPPVMRRFGNRISVSNKSRLDNSYDLIIRNLSFIDIGEYRCGYLGHDHLVSWVDVHQLNVSESGVYDVECAVHGPLVPNIGSTVEFYCEIPPQSIYPQKEVELIWYINKEMLFVSSGLFAPSLAVRLQRTLIESDFGALFTCVAYDEFYQPRGQCNVSTFNMPANVSVRLLASQGESTAGENIRLICVVSSLPSETERYFSWYLDGKRIFSSNLPDYQNDSSKKHGSTTSNEDENNMSLTFENDGEMLTFTHYHSNLNGSLVVCGIESHTGMMMSAPFTLLLPSDFIDPFDANEKYGDESSGGIPLHEVHYFSLLLALLAFVGGIVLAVCIAAIYVNVKQKRKGNSSVDELRWMPIHTTVVDHRSSETFIKRHYIKPPKRLNINERMKRRSDGNFPIISAHQVCLRNKLNERQPYRKSRPLSEDLYNFPMSFRDIPQYHGSKSNNTRTLSRSNSLGHLQISLPRSKPHYENLISFYNPEEIIQRTPDDKVTNLSSSPYETKVSSDTAQDVEANRKQGETVTYAELDLHYLQSIAPPSSLPIRANEAVTYAEIAHAMTEKKNNELKSSSETAFENC